MTPKLRSKIVLESQDSVSDVAESTQEGLIPTMVEQFERNTTDFPQEEFASNIPFKQKVGIGNIDDDDDTHVPTDAEF